MRILYGNSRPLSHAQPPDPANQWRFEVVFDYGEHGGAGLPTPSDAAFSWAVREDPFSTHRPGFELRTYRLCRRVLQFHRFPELGGAPCLVWATEFGHRADPAGTVLESIRFRGYRKDIATGITTDRTGPPLKVTYSAPRTDSSFVSAEPAENVPLGLDGILYQWIDLKNEVPLSTALYKGVAEDASLASIFAPLLINRFTSFRFPCLAASFKGPAFVTPPKKNNEKMTTADIFKFCSHVNITHLLAFEFAQEKRRRRNKRLTTEEISVPLSKTELHFRHGKERVDDQIQLKYISANWGKSNDF